MLLHLLALHVWDEEGGYEVFDEHLGLILLGLYLVDELIEGLGFELCLVVGLEGRSAVDRLAEDVLQERVDGPLVHAHKLLVEHVLTLSEDLLSLSATGLFGFSLSSNVLCHSDHSCDLSLLLEADKFLREVVHGLGDDVSLQTFNGTVNDSLLVAFDQVSLFLATALLLPLFSCSQLGDEVKSLFFALEHHVLDGSASDESLKKNECSLSLILLVLSLIADIVITLVWMLELIFGSRRSDLNLIKLRLLLLLVILDLLLLELFLDRFLGLLQLCHVLNFTAGELAAIVEFEFFNADLRLENFGGQGSAEFLNALV